MFSQLKRLGGDSLLYALMNVGTKIIAFIMFPIYTYYIPDPAVYGVLDYVERITAMLTFLVIFGTDSALAFFYFDTKDEKKRLIYIQQAMLIRLFIIMLCFIFFFIMGKWLAVQLFDDPNAVHLLYISAGILLVDNVLSLILTVLRFQFKTVKVVVLTILKMSLVASLSYLFLVTFMTSIEGILIPRIISSVIVLVFTIKYLVKFISFKINKTILKEILKYAAPLVPASLFFWVIINSNVFFLKEFSTFTEVGIYSTALKFATMITLLTSGVQMAWRPFSMSLKDKPDSPLLFARLYMGILLIGAFGVLIIATVMPWVIQLLGENYHEAYKYVAPIAAVTFLNFYYLIISVGIFFSKKTKFISIAFGISAVLNIVFNFIFIPLFSIWGAVFSYLLSYVIAVILIFNKSQKLYYVPISLIKISFIFCNMLITVFTIIYFQEHDKSWFYFIIAWMYFIVSVLLIRVDKDLLGKNAN